MEKTPLVISSPSLLFISSPGLVVISSSKI